MLTSSPSVRPEKAMTDDQLTEHFANITKEFKGVNERFDAHEKANEREFQHVGSTFAELRTAVGEHFTTLRREMGERFDRMDVRFNGIDARLDRMDRRFDRLEDKLDRALSSRRASTRRGNGK